MNITFFGVGGVGGYFGIDVEKNIHARTIHVL